MKHKITGIILAFFLSITIVGCSSNRNNLSTNNSSSKTNTSSNSTSSKSENTKSQEQSDNNSILEAYKAVLQNKAEFFSTDSKKKLYLNDFLNNNGVYEVTLKVTHFTELDMDGDKVPEVVLELSTGDYPEFYEILHYMDGTVYGYLIVYRGLEQLKTDGTFLYSGGAADNGCGKLIFNLNTYKIDTLGYSKSSQGDGKLIISYFIKDKPVTKESFDSFMNEQGGKKDVVWDELSNFIK